MVSSGEGGGRGQSCWSSQHVKFGKKYPCWFKINKVHEWLDKFRLLSCASCLDSFMYTRSKIQMKPLCLLFSLVGHGAEHRQRSHCSLIAGKGPSGLWDTCPIFSQEICRNLTPLTKHSTTLDQRCSLAGARHRSVWTMYSWVLVEAMPSGEDSRSRLSPPHTCWFPCVHWQERICRTLVLQDSPNTALDVLRASAHFKGASEIHNLTYTWGREKIITYLTDERMTQRK